MLADFSKPQKVSDLDLAFGGAGNLLPAYDDIPEEFKNNFRNKWVKAFGELFFEGFRKGTEFEPKKGIDAMAALKHIRAAIGSFNPKHEHKEAGCAYLFSLWFDDIIFPAAGKPQYEQKNSCH
jgi:hypothetical protein